MPRVAGLNCKLTAPGNHLQHASCAGDHSAAGEAAAPLLPTAASARWRTVLAPKRQEDREHQHDELHAPLQVCTPTAVATAPSLTPPQAACHFGSLAHAKNSKGRPANIQQSHVVGVEILNRCIKVSHVSLVFKDRQLQSEYCFAQTQLRRRHGMGSEGPVSNQGALPAR